MSKKFKLSIDTQDAMSQKKKNYSFLEHTLLNKYLFTSVCIDTKKLKFLGSGAHGGIARLPGDSVEIEGEQGRVQPQPCSGDRGLTAGVTTSHDDHVEDFARGRGEAHGFIIRSYGSGSDPPGVLFRCSVS